MKSFKEYRRAKLPATETVFGQHSENLTESMIHGNSEEDHARIHSANKFDSTDPGHIGAIYEHSESSHELNSFLLDAHKTNIVADDHMVEKANKLTDALNSSKIKEATHVYTGIKHSPVKLFENDSELKPKVVHLPSFTSTSTSRPMALNFAAGNVDMDGTRHGIEDDSFNRHILKIHVPVGTSGTSIVEHAMMPREKEILLNRGHNIEIDPTPEKVTNNVYQWNAKIVSHTPQKL